VKQASVDDLYVAVATGIVGAKDVIHVAYPELRAARAPRVLPSFMGGGLTSRSPRSAGQADSGMPITGIIAGMDVHYAGCCHPLPGDKIVGIVTTGKGVTVHAKDCATLDTFAATPERFIDIDWDAASIAKMDPKTQKFTGRISVIANNAPNALASLTNAVAKQDGAIANLKVVNRQQDFFETLVDVEVRDARHLNQMIAGLRGPTGIARVERERA
jgi:GTP diphosphokinase / guanosine-3',5'-bis(diphosphate) 3'-diphosphatase